MFQRCLIWAGGDGFNPNETLSHSNGKFVFDYAPKTDMTQPVVKHP